MRIQLLGPVRVWRGDDPVDLGPTGRRAVLGLLALAGGQPLSRAELVDALWGQNPPASAVNVVQTHVKHLRRALEPDRQRYTASGLLPKAGDGYALRLPSDSVDLFRFRRLVTEAARRWSDGDVPATAALLAEATGVWRGPALADVPQLAGHPKVVALAAERRVALARYGEAMLAAGAAGEALPVLEEVVGEQPLDEAAQARLIRAYQAAGRRADAFSRYHEVRRLLVDELGVDPGPELAGAYADLLRPGDAPPAGAPPDRPENPAPRRPATTAPDRPEHPAPTRMEPPAPAQVPPDVAGFTGRTELLATLDRLLPADPRGTADPSGTGGPHETATGPGGRPASVAVAVLHGTAGVGKTALAVHWAHRVADRFPDGQLHADLRGFDPTGSPADPEEVVRAFLDALGVPPQGVPAGLAAQVGLYRSLLAGRRMLIMLDNARDARQVRPLLPGAPGCLVLVTSRHRLTGLIATAGATPVAVDLPSPAEARRLLAGRLGTRRLAAEPGAADELVDRCARLPLALAVVAARAAADADLPLSTYAAELRPAHDGLEPFTGDDPATDVRAVFSCSYRALTGPGAALFRLTAVLPAPEFTTAAAASLTGLSGPDTRRALTELVDAHLLAARGPGRFTGHDLLRRYATELAGEGDSTAERRTARLRILDHYLHSAYVAADLLHPDVGTESDPPPAPLPGVRPEQPADAEQARTWFGAEMAALVAVAGAGSDVHTQRLARILAEPLDRQSRWRELAEIQQAALTAAARTGDRAGQAHAHRGLARARARLDDRRGARHHLDRALNLYVALGDHAGQARTHIGLSWMCGVDQRYAAALEHAEHALRLFTAAGSTAGQANARNTAGWFHAQLGDQVRGLEYCRQALTLYQRIGDLAGQADTWDSLGLAHHRLGEHKSAAACYQEALTLYRRLTARYNEADTLTRLADTQAAAGWHAAALAARQQALAILDDLRHPRAAELRHQVPALDGLPAVVDGRPVSPAVRRAAPVRGGGSRANRVPATRTWPPAGR